MPTPRSVSRGAFSTRRHRGFSPCSGNATPSPLTWFLDPPEPALCNVSASRSLPNASFSKILCCMTPEDNLVKGQGVVHFGIVMLLRLREMVMEKKRSLKPGELQWLKVVPHIVCGWHFRYLVIARVARPRSLKQITPSMHVSGSGVRISKEGLSNWK